jgi:hypothetical protein
MAGKPSIPQWLLIIPGFLQHWLSKAKLVWKMIKPNTLEIQFAK